MDPTTRALEPGCKVVDRSPTRNSEALAGDPIGGKENDEEIDQTRTTNYHAVPTLAQGIVGMALEHQPVRWLAPIVGKERRSNKWRGGELETRVSGTGYLASMIRYDENTHKKKIFFENKPPCRQESTQH